MTTGSIKARQRVERSIARRVILDALRAGYALSVFDGEDEIVPEKQQVKTILGLMFTVDDEYLFLKRDTIDATGQTATISGWVRFIYGNDGYDVISDYTTNLEDVLKGANALADCYAD